jgi:hypothetical protein
VNLTDTQPLPPDQRPDRSQTTMLEEWREDVGVFGLWLRAFWRRVSPLYSGLTTRDPRLDWLRGYCFLVMTIDHFGGRSSLYVLTGQTQFFTSAAEAFYLISGLTLGLVSSRSSVQQSVRRVLKRTRTLYLTSVTMALGFGALGVFTTLRLWAEPDVRVNQFLNFAWRSLTLRAGTHGSEILVLYVALMLLSPLAFYAFAQRRTWLVVLASSLVYILGVAAPKWVHTPLASLFDPATWQILFFAGLVIGFHRQDLARVLAESKQLRGVLEVATVTVGLGFVLLFVTHYAIWPSLPAILGAREWLRPIRLALVALELQTAYILISWLWKPLRMLTGWFLEPLGRGGLTTFVLHFVVIDFLYNLPTYSTNSNLSGFSTGFTGKTDQTLWQVTALLSLWLLVRFHALAHAFLRDPPANGEHFWADRRYLEMRGMNGSWSSPRGNSRNNPRASTVIMRAARTDAIRISERREHPTIEGAAKTADLENQAKRNGRSSPDSQT